MEKEFEKLCSGGCNRVLPLSEFARLNNAKDGLQSQCKECIGERASKGKAEKKAAIERACGVGGTIHFTEKIVVQTPDVSAAEPPTEEVVVEAPGGGRKILSIDMTEFPFIYDMILDVSRTEFRTPEMQCLYWLNQKVQVWRD